MRKKTALIASCLLGGIAWLTSRVGLASTNQHYDIALWQMPFTGRVVQLPTWAWGVAVCIGLASMLMIPVLWISVAIKSWKLRNTLN
jgi:hypothetical protein